MSYKRINITIPDDDLRKIDEFCSEEKISKSHLIREATTNYITEINKQKEIERKRKEVEWAIEMMDKLRKKVKFTSGKTAAEMVRELRDSR